MPQQPKSIPCFPNAPHKRTDFPIPHGILDWKQRKHTLEQKTRKTVAMYSWNKKGKYLTNDSTLLIIMYHRLENARPPDLKECFNVQSNQTVSSAVPTTLKYVTIHIISDPGALSQ